MDHAPPPGRHTIQQEPGFQLAFLVRMRTATTPPAHGSHHRRSQTRFWSDQKQTEPIHPGNTDGTARGTVVAGLVVREAMGLAGAHGTQIFHLLTLWFLPHTLVPDGIDRLSQ